jgi:hypothetical protein
MMRLYEKDWFLSVEIARAMPFFKRLDLNDKVKIEEIGTLYKFNAD